MQHSLAARGAAGLLTAAVLLAGVGMLAVDPTWFRSYTHFSVTVDQGFGIRPNLPVTIAGMEVGYVGSVALDERRNVRLDLLVETPYARHVHVDSSVQVMQLLSGRYVEIRGGRGHPLDAGGEILFGTNHDPLLTLVDLDLPRTLEQFADLLRELNRLIVLLPDEDGGLASTLEAAGRIVHALDDGQGTLGRLLKDDAPLEDVLIVLSDVQILLVGLQGTLRDVDDAAGSVGEAGQSVKTATDGIGSATSALARTAGKIDGTLTPVQETLARLDGTLHEVELTLRAIQQLPMVRKGVDRPAEEGAAPSPGSQ